MQNKPGFARKPRQSRLPPIEAHKSVIEKSAQAKVQILP